MVQPHGVNGVRRALVLLLLWLLAGCAKQPENDLQLPSGEHVTIVNAQGDYVSNVSGVKRHIYWEPANRLLVRPGTRLRSNQTSDVAARRSNTVHQGACEAPRHRKETHRLSSRSQAATSS